MCAALARGARWAAAAHLGARRIGGEQTAARGGQIGLRHGHRDVQEVLQLRGGLGVGAGRGAEIPEQLGAVPLQRLRLQRAYIVGDGHGCAQGAPRGRAGRGRGCRRAWRRDPPPASTGGGVRAQATGSSDERCWDPRAPLLCLWAARGSTRLFDRSPGGNGRARARRARRHPPPCPPLACPLRREAPSKPYNVGSAGLGASALSVQRGARDSRVEGKGVGEQQGEVRRRRRSRGRRAAAEEVMGGKRGRGPAVGAR
jgi:hypothetical protein